MHIGEQRRIGLYVLHIGCIPLGLQGPGLSSGFLEHSCELSLKVAPGFLEPWFLGPCLTIILI